MERFDSTFGRHGDAGASAGTAPAHDRLGSASGSRPAKLWMVDDVPGIDDRLQRWLDDAIESARSVSQPGTAWAARIDAPLRLVARRMTSIDAQRTIAPDGRHVVFINAGFVLFIYNFMRIIGAQMSFSDAPSHGAPPSREEAARRVSELLDWCTGPLELPRIRTFPITRDQMRNASDLASAAEYFIVAHELGHELAGHQPVGAQEVVIDDEHLMGMRLSWEQELEADAIALVLHIASARRAGSDLNPQIYTGLELLFHALSLIEAFGAAGLSESHPPSAMRRQTLRAELERLHPDYRQYLEYAEAAEQRLDAWRPLIEDGARARQSAVAARFDRLLRLPPGPEVTAELDSLMQEYPTATIARVRSEIEAFFAGSGGDQRLSRNRGRVLGYVVLGGHPALQQALGVDALLEQRWGSHLAEQAVES